MHLCRVGRRQHGATMVGSKSRCALDWSVNIELRERTEEVGYRVNKLDGQPPVFAPVTTHERRCRAHRDIIPHRDSHECRRRRIVEQGLSCELQIYCEANGQRVRTKRSHFGGMYGVYTDIFYISVLPRNIVFTFPGPFLEQVARRNCKTMSEYRHRSFEDLP